METSGTMPDENRHQSILSICIPTCNRADFLKVMLQALLPQVKEQGRAVEVWILDNGSTDKTSEILEASRELGPFQVHRQPKNIGPTRNIVMGPTQLATGLYTWVLGDHNLLRPHALATVVRELTAHPDIQAFYINYRAANFPEHWPQSAVAGHEGEFSYVGNPDVRPGIQKSWCNLLTPHSAACTQNYVHILRTDLWRDYWRGRAIGDDYSDAETTYPHTVTAACTGIHAPCFVISECMFTIFNGAQSWQDPVSRIRVYCNGLPSLLRLYESLGVPRDQISLLYCEFAIPLTRNVFDEALRQRGSVLMSQIMTQHCAGASYAIGCFLTALFKHNFPNLMRSFTKHSASLRNPREWYICNFRPARFLRSLLKPTETP